MFSDEINNINNTAITIIIHKVSKKLRINYGRLMKLLKLIKAN